LGGPTAVWAQTVAATNDAATASEGIDEVIVTGTRETGVRALDSATPIQVVSADALKATGAGDLMSALTQTVPSLQMQAFGADMSGQTLQARLRGVSPNDVLVLINGKRRHTTANLAVDSGTPFQGGAGVDLNFIPLDAIDHVEVLTDGAAAQYGSDAIAGVVNIILKKNSSGGSLDALYGQYGTGGGKTEDISGNAGLEPTEGGYFNLTANYRNHGHSDVGAEDPRLFPQNLGQASAGEPAVDLNAANVPGYPNQNQIFGDAATIQKLVALNAGWDLAGGTELYLVTTYGHKDAVSYENYRPPGVVNYTDPTTGVTTYPLPGGFSPQEADFEDDYQFTGGVKGSIVGWDWDLSTGFGGDHDNLNTLDTVNAGVYGSTGNLQAGSLNNYHDGNLQATQWNSTLDVRHEFDVGLAGPLNFAFGVAHRRDTYSITPGLPITYEDGGLASYPGFTPLDASSHSRTNNAGYLDFAAKPIDKLQVDAAVRFEHYSDFGNATIGKLSGRYDFSPEFAIRASANNGFRAPTLAEEYYSATNVGPVTAFIQLPPNSPAGQLVGLGNGLQPEKSVDFSVGFVWRPIEHLSATLDLYQIAITNRIVGTGNIYGKENGVEQPGYPGVSAAIAAYAHGNNLINPAVLATGSYGINIFANGIDTRTDGADLVFNFPYEYTFGNIVYSIGSNMNTTSITKRAASPASLGGAALYDQEAYSELTTASPKFVFNLGALYTVDKLSVDLVEKIIGPTSDFEQDDGDNPTGNSEYFKDQQGTTLITNLDIGYQFTENLKLSVGAQNLFNRFPNQLNSTLLEHLNVYGGQLGDPTAVEHYPFFSPFGIDGGFYYVKASYKF